MSSESLEQASEAVVKGGKLKSKSMREQGAFRDTPCVVTDLSVTSKLCKRVLSLPMHPYLEEAEQRKVIEDVKGYVWSKKVNIVGIVFRGFRWEKA